MGALARATKIRVYWTDGSVVIVPQGYVALLVNNGTFLGDLLEAGEPRMASR